MWNAEVEGMQEISTDVGKHQRQGFSEGFAIAFFNPKIALFLVAILAQVLKLYPEMGFETKLAIGLLGMAIDTLWYVLVALVLTGTPALEALRNKGEYVYKITAVALWFFAVSVISSLI